MKYMEGSRNTRHRLLDSTDIAGNLNLLCQEDDLNGISRDRHQQYFTWLVHSSNPGCSLSVSSFCFCIHVCVSVQGKHKIANREN